MAHEWHGSGDGRRQARLNFVGEVADLHRQEVEFDGSQIADLLEHVDGGKLMGGEVREFGLGEIVEVDSEDFAGLLSLQVNGIHQHQATGFPV